MTAMVDAFGAASYCDVCDAPTDEADLEDDDAGRMVCGHCRKVQGELAEIMADTKEGS